VEVNMTAKPKPDPNSEAEKRKRLERKLEKGLEDTFPASDPVAVTEPGPPVRKPDGKKNKRNKKK
jgi:hypothetical protein